MFTYERVRERKRERCCVCMNDHRNSKAVVLNPSETMMYQLLVEKDNVALERLSFFIAKIVGQR